MSSRVTLATAVAVLVLTALTSTSAPAETLTGRVLDPQGAVVPRAELQLFARAGTDEWTTRSADDGTYRFTGLADGAYLLTVRAASGRLAGTSPVDLAGDQTLDVTLALTAVSTEVVVTASSTAVGVLEVGKAVDVIDSQEIRLRNELSIAESLRTTPGLRVRTLRGPGSFTTIQTRGLRNQDTAVLIDGMRFRDAAAPQGDASGFLGNLPVVDTDRLEVLRGSGSTLYGSAAMAGVINVTSRTGGGPPRGDLIVEGGGLGLVRTVPTIQGGALDDRLSYSGAVSYLNMTEGVRKEQSYRSVSPQGMIRYEFAPGLSATGRFWYMDDDQQLNESPAFPDEVVANFPATGPVPALALPTDQLEAFEEGRAWQAGNATFVPDQDDPDQQRESSFFSGQATLRQVVSPNASYRVGYQAVDTNRAFIDGPLGGGPFDPLAENRSVNDGRTDTVLAQLDSSVGAVHFLSAGYEFEREGYVSSSSDSGASVDIQNRSHAFFAQDQITLVDGRLTLTLGGRAQIFDLGDPIFVGGDHPYQGVAFEAPNAFTGDAAVAYVVGRATKIRAHVGNSYRAPSAFERFGGSFSSFSNSFSFWGDPRLNPERSVAYDAGVDQWLFDSRLQLSGTFFYTDLRETIIFDFANFPPDDPFGRFGGYRNTGGGRATGFEVSAHASPTNRTTLRVAYTYTDATADEPTVGDDFFGALGISDHLFTMVASHWFADRLNVTFDLFAASDYSLSPFGAQGRRLIFGGPVRGDVVVRYGLLTGPAVGLDLYAKVENLFDQLYYENGFLGPGAWAIGGVRVRY